MPSPKAWNIRLLLPKTPLIMTTNNHKHHSLYSVKQKRLTHILDASQPRCPWASLHVLIIHFTSCETSIPLVGAQCRHQLLLQALLKKHYMANTAAVQMEGATASVSLGQILNFKFQMIPKFSSTEPILFTYQSNRQLSTNTPQNIWCTSSRFWQYSSIPSAADSTCYICLIRISWKSARKILAEKRYNLPHTPLTCISASRLLPSNIQRLHHGSSCPSHSYQIITSRSKSLRLNI